MIPVNDDELCVMKWWQMAISQLLILVSPIVLPLCMLIDKIQGNKPNRFERGMSVIYLIYSLMLWTIIAVIGGSAYLIWKLI